MLNVTTLGMPRMNQLLDTITPDEHKRYMHHYNFPPFSTGETGFMRGPKRREIGHGLLAERALLPVVPYEEDFPYTLRLVSDVLASNGSTSMASVCGSTLSMMAAGVPLKAPVAGIAMGLVYDGGTYVTLTDILGAEDAFGDMDFKVAGTKDVVTALQLDTKIDGLPLDVLTKALLQAKEARLTILDVMAGAIAEPRTEVAESAPKIVSFEIPMDKIGEVIGPKGKVINALQQETGADIAVDDDGMVGTVTIGAKDGTAVEEARRRIATILDPPLAEVGATYQGKVVNITKFGAFVNILPGRDGLLHISKIGQGKRVERVEDVLELGQPVEVRVDDIDPQGKVSLSLAGEPPAGRHRRREERGSRGDRGGRSRPPRGDHADPGDRPDRGRRPAESDARHRPVRPRSRKHSRRSWSRSSATSGRPWPSRPIVPVGVAEAAGVVAAAVDRVGRPEVAPVLRPPRRVAAHPMRTSSAQPGAAADWSGRVIRTEDLDVGPVPGHRADGRRPVGVHRLLGGHRVARRGRRRGRRLALPRAPAVQGHRRPFALGHRRGGRRGGRGLQRLHHQGVHLLLHPPAGRAPRPWGWTSSRDIMWRPALRPADLDAERQVILDEILMHADEPADEAAEQSSALLFPDHPLGREVLGTQESVAAMTAERIREFFDAALPARQHGGGGGRRRGPRVGGRGARGPVRRARRGGDPGAARRPTTRSSRCGVTRRATEQAHWSWPSRSVDRSDPRRYALAVLNHVLGGGLSSRLFQEIRERRGLAYSVWSERVAYHDAGIGERRAWGPPPSTWPRCSTSSPPSWPGWATTGSPSGSWPSPRATSGPRPCWPARTPGPG